MRKRPTGRFSIRPSGSSEPTGSGILAKPSDLSSAQPRSPKPKGTTRILVSAGVTRGSRCTPRRSRDCTRTTSSWRQSSIASPRRAHPEEDQGSRPMPTYIMLANWTDQGAQKVKDSPRRLEIAKKALFDMGGEFKRVYMTLGEYDLVGVYEAPDDAVAARFSLMLGMLGSVRTKTLKAFPEAAYREIIASLG